MFFTDVKKLKQKEIRQLNKAHKITGYDPNSFFAGDDFWIIDCLDIIYREKEYFYIITEDNQKLYVYFDEKDCYKDLKHCYIKTRLGFRQYKYELKQNIKESPGSFWLEET